MNKTTMCAFPWIHMSSHLDGTMLLCCNTYSKASIKKNNSQEVWKLTDVTNPLEYFNSDDYKKIRLDMLNGREPEICKKCYDTERNGGHSIRQNTFHEADFDELISKTNTETGELNELTLDYAHFMWGNKCNLKCKMCSPDASNQLIEEFKALNRKMPNDVDQYIKTWDFNSNRPLLEKIAPHLKRMNVTGGEPLINNDFLEYCKFLTDQGYSKNMHLAFHTNLTVMPTKFIESWKNFNRVTVKLSIDAIDEDYEYIRYPGKWSIIKDNLENLIKLTDNVSNINVEVHTVFTAFNAHAIPRLIDFLTSINHPNFLNFPNTLWVTQPPYSDSRCIPRKAKEKITQDCMSVIEKLSTVEDQRIQNNINNLMANLKAMNEEEISPEKFIKFNLAQDVLRTVQTKNILPWWNLLNTSPSVIK